MRKIIVMCGAMLSFAQDTLAEDIQAEEKPVKETPVVGDWQDALWFDDLVKIPLKIDQSTNWFANLIMGTGDEQNANGYCMFDNNSPRTIVYPNYSSQSTYTDWYTAPTDTCDKTKTRELNSVGLEISGYDCSQTICIGSAQDDILLDVHTTVCNKGQKFLDSTTIPWNNWSYYYNRYGATNAICGLGKEAATVRSQSFVGLAAVNGDIPKNMYSFEIYPHLQLLSTANVAHLHKAGAEGETPDPDRGHALSSYQSGKPYQYDLEVVSYLTLGGYDSSDFTGNLTWYDTSASGDSWNLTATSMSIGDVTMNPNNATVGPTLNFQIGYPFLQFAPSTWESYKYLIFNQWNPDLMNKRQCSGWRDNEFCYWYNTYCEDVNMPENLNIVIGYHNYTIPMKYFLADTDYNGRHDCDVYISEFDPETSDAETTVRLGDPFFAAFLPVFDSENEALGLAVSARALTGVEKIEIEQPSTEPTGVESLLEQFTQ